MTTGSESPTCKHPPDSGATGGQSERRAGSALSVVELTDKRARMGL
jgi:hypothetical protein